MQKNTFEDYKLAVKKKYDTEKNSSHHVYLENPTRARLRNLCWELFQQQNRTQDDLSVFNSLLGLPFDINKRNKFDEQSDKFRPIETFFKGETDPTNIDAVNMAAILVDYSGRPFNKFRILSLYEDDILVDNELDLSNTPKEEIDSSRILDKFIEEKEREKGTEKGVFEVIHSTPQGISSFADVEKKPEKIEKPQEPTKRGIPPITKKYAILIASIFLFVGFVVVFFAFPNKDCMQWSGDHYDIVDCELKIEGIGKSVNIEILDPTLVNLKKIKVCDTTTYFDKNGVAIIWYAKTANGVDFFNVHGRHPENNSPLRPVTHYILNKYVKR
ncbi:hypothetical protein KHA90_21045 [Flavobacterium psychroterrae]|uniref:Uncharacterized protein n=1 Tax=Flavobacterium psychroterrae TaxID=2133767 RepID=A0ABS5PGQ8_9FLAO|nr:hypothetical protein [Flavobacterium psychroterrae]MBS7233504.1 hypothetical protein [Flavobacterium psychroterrae]